MNRAQPDAGLGRQWPCLRAAGGWRERPGSQTRTRGAGPMRTAPDRGPRRLGSARSGPRVWRCQSPSDGQAVGDRRYWPSRDLRGRRSVLRRRRADGRSRWSRYRNAPPPWLLQPAPVRRRSVTQRLRAGSQP